MDGARDAWKRYTSDGSWYYEVVRAGYKANAADPQAALGFHSWPSWMGSSGGGADHRRYTAEFSTCGALFRCASDRLMRGTCTWCATRRAENRSGESSMRTASGERRRERPFIPLHRHPVYQTLGYKPPISRAQALYSSVFRFRCFPDVRRDVTDVVTALTGRFGGGRSHEECARARSPETDE
jgi:dTDP-4-amino-4,6-dideoxygalactose transaminase